MEGGMNVNGGNAGFDMFSFKLTPPGSEGEEYDNLATDIKGVPIGKNASSEAFAGHFGFSENDTIDSTKLDDVFLYGQQLNISIGLTGSPDTVIQLYLNTVDPSLPSLAPIKSMLVITERQLQKGSLAGFQLFVADQNLQAANKKKDGDEKSGNSTVNNVGGLATNNDSAAFQAATLGANPVTQGTTNNSGDSRIVRDRVVGAAGAAKEVDPRNIDDSSQAAGSTANKTEGNNASTDPKGNVNYAINTNENASGNSGDNSGNSSGNNSRNQSGAFAMDPNSLSVSDSIEAHAQVMDDLNISITDNLDAASATNAAANITVTIQKTSGGNPWLAGNTFVEFQVAFSMLQRILMQNSIVQGRVELAGMKMTVDLSRQSADAIMAIAKMNQMMHIVAAIMAAVSIVMTVGALVGGAVATFKGGVKTTADGTEYAHMGRFGGLSENQWNLVGGMG
ncbi:MAG TPA: hypothetical protein VGP47_01110, partial [Parachlamydiaceae bacterium]|nr:hypothetical protein [Parachlamydiaceae bacterium]